MRRPSHPSPGEARALEAQPGLVLLLSDLLESDAARAFERALRSRIDPPEGVALIDAARLRAWGFTRGIPGAFTRMRLERELVRAAAAKLDNAVVDRASRFPVVLVGFLSDADACASAMAVLPPLLSALDRIAFPRGLEPVIVGLWVIPPAWTRVDAARLYAWLKEIAPAAWTPADAEPPIAAYDATFILGRSAAHEEARASSPILGEVDAAAVAAEWVACCFRTRLLDWTLQAARGTTARSAPGAIGIARVESTTLECGGSALDRAAELSGVLWPGTPSTVVRPPTGVRRGVAGVTGMAAEAASHRLADWDHIAPIGRDGCDGAWLVQFAPGLRPDEIGAAPDWRECYLSLPLPKRRRLHGVPAAAEWPDPLEVMPEPELAVAAPPPAI